MCRTIGATATPDGHEARQQLRREAAAGGGHLRATGLRFVHGAVAVDGPRLADVAVADGLAVRVEVVDQRSGEVELRDPEAHACFGPEPVAVRREQRDRSVLRQPDGLAWLRVEEREARGLRGLSQLDDAEAGGEGRGEVDVDRGAVGAGAVERRREGAAGVDDDDVAFAEESRQVAESRVFDAAAALRRDHEAHAVAREAAGFGRLGGFELRREVEGDAGVSDRVLSASCFRRHLSEHRGSSHYTAAGVTWRAT